MRINIDLTKDLAEAAGNDRIELDLTEKSPSLSEVIATLIQKHPKLKDMLVENDGSLSYHILVFINEVPLQNTDDTKIILKEGDLIRFLPVIGGG